MLHQSCSYQAVGHEDIASIETKSLCKKGSHAELPLKGISNICKILTPSTPPASHILSAESYIQEYRLLKNYLNHKAWLKAWRGQGRLRNR